MLIPKPVGPHCVNEGGGAIPLFGGKLGPREVHVVQRRECPRACVGNQVDAERDHRQHRSATSGQPPSRQERGNERQHGKEAEQGERELTIRYGRDQVQRLSGVAVVGHEQSADRDCCGRHQQDHGCDNAPNLRRLGPCVGGLSVYSGN